MSELSFEQMLDETFKTIRNGEVRQMSVIQIILTVIYVLLGVAISIVVLMQEGKSNGLGSAIGGMADSYWSKNKGRSMEGALEHFTRYGAIVFMVITLILNVLLERIG